MKSKVYESPKAALEGLAKDGMTVAVGGDALISVQSMTNTPTKTVPWR